MAASQLKYPVGSPQEHIQICKNHSLRMDMVCEDCDKFICSTCAKTDHSGHNWVTQGVAARRRRKGLLGFLRNIKEKNLTKVDDEEIAKKMVRNERKCESERKKLKKYFDEMIAKLTDIRDQKDEALKSNLRMKNEHLAFGKSRIDKKQKQILEIIKYMEENNRTMSDKNLIENHRDLKHLLADLEIDRGNNDFSVIYQEKVIDEYKLESLFGECFDFDQISVTKTNSFVYSKNLIMHLETLNENECYVKGFESDNVAMVNKQGEKKQTFNVGSGVTDLCVTNNGIYFTAKSDNFIRCLSLSGSISTVWRTEELDLEPIGICNSLDGGFLVSLDSKTDYYKLKSGIRGLVKHLTLTGEVIKEYEYREDGRTRLFTQPGRLCQNNNTDICVVNMIRDNAGELMILSVSGRLRSVYRGQNLKKNFFPADIVCDFTCNILVTDTENSLIHILSPDGEYLKYLLTEKEVTHPTTLSLYKSALWVGNGGGLVEVFKYKNLP